jgi:sec-independent protein translocase protein TatA
MGTPGPLEIILIFLVVLLIFGAKRIPEIARGIGKGIREFKDATSEISRELDVENNQPRQQIDQTRRPQQGTPQARGSAQPSAANEAPPQPAQANNPGDESESSREQQASQ